MFDRLDQLEARYEELGMQLSDPNIVNDQENYRKVSKQHRDMEPTVEKFREYRKLHTAVADAKAMLTDADMRDMAQAELDDLEPKLATVEEELKVLLLPKDPNDDKNIVLELRAGTGGDEASLFVAAGAGANFKNHVLLVVGILGQQQYLDLFLKFRLARRQRGNLFGGHGAHFGVWL